jgi:hypothetical protein
VKRKARAVVPSSSARKDAQRDFAHFRPDRPPNFGQNQRSRAPAGIELLDRSSVTEHGATQPSSGAAVRDLFWRAVAASNSPTAVQVLHQPLVPLYVALAPIVRGPSPPHRLSGAHFHIFIINGRQVGQAGQ